MHDEREARFDVLCQMIENEAGIFVARTDRRDLLPCHRILGHFWWGAIGQQEDGSETSLFLAFPECAHRGSNSDAGYSNQRDLVERKGWRLWLGARI
ncbi:hypothetical protein CLG96_14775 [Sphingomonas oleivorans]|uniref:Uncharacterized protein n=1 Tax=Sphingomonas oleivorans TaxID=1735121 RepID=A0A2T5FVA9_9SPHN|nr:hypothetical protein CLG96_14775 [Sphingomonas oleivorans]